MASIVKLSAEETRESGFTHLWTIEYTDITAAVGATDLTLTVTGPTVAQGDCVTRAGFVLATNFNSADTALRVGLEVGDDGDVDRFVPTKEVNVNGTEITDWITSQVTGTLPYAYVAANTVDALFTATGTTAYLSELTAGKVIILLAIGRLRRLTGVA